MTHLDLSSEHLGALAECYADSFATLDRLPYTKPVDSPCEGPCQKTGQRMHRHSIWRVPCSLRKANRLARKER